MPSKFSLIKKVGTIGVVGALAAAAAWVYSAATFTPADQPFGYAPPLALTGFDLSTGDQKVFQTWFDKYSWRGDVVAYPVSKTGETDVTTRLWFASEKLATMDPTSVDCVTCRKIVTRNGTSNVPFRWAQVPAHQGVLGSQDVLNFVRGDRSKEKELREEQGDGTIIVKSGTPAGIFRARQSVFGDIIHSKPIYVGAPVADYTFDNYLTAFRAPKQSRPGRVYVGANDGMVHALDAATGKEIFAYIPSMIVSNLSKLKDDPYKHTYFVDGGMTAGDVFVGGRWRTVLVGGLGAGGKGIYALDVTETDNVSEAATADKILWEHTDATLNNLGDTYGDPLIVKLNTGDWAALVPNGYNSASPGKAVLYVINILNGTVIASITAGNPSPGTPNGLSSPAAVDYDNDGRIDFVYAGDIDGNMHKFDLRGSVPGSWKSSVLYETEKSITAAPDVAGHPQGGFMVYFATGRLLTPTDATDAAVQNYIYGIWDGAPAAITAAGLLYDQTFDEVLYRDQVQRTRVTETKADPISWSKHMGWRSALPTLGERVITPGFVRDGRYHFVTTNPTVKNATPPDGENWLMELNYINGGTDGKLIFDLSGADDLGNAKLDDFDRVNDGSLGGAGPETVPVGVWVGSGLISPPLLALVSAGFSTTLFNSDPFAGPGEGPKTVTVTIVTDPCPPPTVCGPGVAGGHFDWDVYHGATAGSFEHTHQYDDKYNVVGGNFLNAGDATYNLYNTGISGNTVQADSKFFILLSNGDLSPGVTLTIGGVDTLAWKYPNKWKKGERTVYDLTTVKKFQFRMPVDAFSSKDWMNCWGNQNPVVDTVDATRCSGGVSGGTFKGLVAGTAYAGLIPTATGCVKTGVDSTPGKNAEVHNGSLTIWIVKAPQTDAEEATLAAALKENVPGRPMRGWRVNNDSIVFKRYTVFWHNGACYDNASWIQNPPANDNGNSNGSSGAPGSDDPKSGTTATAVSTSESFQKSDKWNGVNDVSGTRKTTTTYSDQSKTVTTETIDKNGKVKSTGPVYVPPGSTTTTTTTTTTGGSYRQNKPGDTLTGYQQSRLAGKLGRVAWHELIKE